MNTSKNWIWILIAVVVLTLLWTAWQYGFFNRPITTKESVQQPVSDRDTTADISNDLDWVGVGNPDQDLKQLDADLNQL